MSRYAVLLEYRPSDFRFGKIVVRFHGHQSGDGLRLPPATVLGGRVLCSAPTVL
jgi:hypothetical protein